MQIRFYADLVDYCAFGAEATNDANNVRADTACGKKS